MNLPDGVQISQLEFVATGIEKYILGGVTLTNQLEAIARQSFRCYICACEPTSWERSDCANVAWAARPAVSTKVAPVR